MNYLNLKKSNFYLVFSKEADFTINGNSGKVKELDEITNWKSEHYIKVINDNEKNLLKKQMSYIKYNLKSSVSGENAWISQYEILERYYNSGIELIGLENIFFS